MAVLLCHSLLRTEPTGGWTASKAVHSLSWIRKGDKRGRRGRKRSNGREREKKKRKKCTTGSRKRKRDSRLYSEERKKGTRVDRVAIA